MSLSFSIIFFNYSTNLRGYIIKFTDTLIGILQKGILINGYTEWNNLPIIYFKQIIKLQETNKQRFAFNSLTKSIQ